MRKQRILAALLAFVLVLSLVPAVQLSASANVAEDADVIRLPITVRDVNQDNVLFQINYKDLNSFDHDPDLGHANNYYVDHKLVNGVPQYNDAAIQIVAGLIVNYHDYSNNNYATNNGYLYDALQAAKTGKEHWNNTKSSQYDEDVTYLEDAPTAYSAAKWILSHLFEDGQYYEDQPTIQGEFDASKNYTKTYPDYESLVLKKGTYSGEECYFYTSNYPLGGSENNLQKTMFNYTTNHPANNDEIYNTGANSNNNNVVGTNSQSGGWFPLDKLGFNQSRNGAENDSHNFHTTTAGSGQFVYHKADNLFFAFTGDDDFFFYINDQLVIDFGGVHGQQLCEVYLEDSVASTDGDANGHCIDTGVTDPNMTWADYLGLEEGGIYNFNFFQMERCATYSNFSMYTNIKVVDSSAVPAKKAYQNGQELIYGSFVPQNSEVTYGFEMTNNGNTKVNGSASAITNLTFVDDLLGVILKPDNIVIYTNASQNTYADLEYAIYKTEDGAPSTYTKLTNETGETTLKSLLAAGVQPGYTFSIRGFKYNVGMPSTGETTKTIVNTVTTTAVGQANNSGKTKTLHGTASMRIRTWDIQNKTFVMDYAKTMTLTNAEVFGSELKDLSGNGITVSEVVNTEDVVTTAKLSTQVGNVTLDKATDNAGTVATGAYGTMTLTGSLAENNYGLTYTPTKILSGIDSYIVKIKLDTTTTIGNADPVSGSNILNKNVTIVPANNVYYEDTFVDTTDTTGTSVQIVYNGKATTGNSDGNTENAENSETGTGSGVHGWEDSLADDAQFSDGSATQMTAGATATFTFTGTGVDIYSYTDMTTGIVTAKLIDVSGNEATKYLMVDNLAVSGKYYQIPTLFWNDLDYGTYTVTLVVNNAKAVDHIDDDGNIIYGDATRNTYYLDGIRVYNPIKNQESTETVKEAYGTEELNAVFKGVRELMAEDTAVDSEQGKVFIDLNGTVGKESAYNATEYGTYGPKNEVYLAPGQSITFEVGGNSDNYYQIGLKAPEGTTRAAFSNTDESNSDTEIAHSTDLYYKVTPVNGKITIKNTGETNILSVTKVKMTGTDTTSGIMLLDMTAEEATAEIAAFSLRSTVAYTAESDMEEEVVPEEPEVPDIDVDIENPTEPDEDPTQDPDPNEVLKDLIIDLFKKIFGWFGH